METKNRQSFSSFCAELSCGLAHIRKSWSGYNPTIKRAVFTIWDDRLDKKRMRYEFGEAISTDGRFGAKELRKNIYSIISLGGDAFGIQCIAKDIQDSPRARKSFDQERVLSLRLTEERGKYVAYVLGEVSVLNVKIGFTNKIVPYPDAINDLDSDPPIGNLNPSRTAGTYSGFRRDPKIRAAVLKRAKGKCEFCGERGFALPDDAGYYVEAHHIIHLSKNGIDTMDNVIALCSNHHREAHYGLNAEALERSLLSMLRDSHGQK